MLYSPPLNLLDLGVALLGVLLDDVGEILHGFGQRGKRSSTVRSTSTPDKPSTSAGVEILDRVDDQLVLRLFVLQLVELLLQLRHLLAQGLVVLMTSCSEIGSVSFFSVDISGAPARDLSSAPLRRPSQIFI